MQDRRRNLRVKPPLLSKRVKYWAKVLLILITAAFSIVWLAGVITIVRRAL